MLLIHLVAQKTSDSTAGTLPQQGSYVTVWNDQVPRSQEQKRKVDPITRLGISLKKKIKRRTPFFVKRYLKRRKLKKIAQY